MTIRERAKQPTMRWALALAAALWTVTTAAWASGGRPTDPLMPMATTADIYIYVTMTAPVGPPPPLLQILPVIGAEPQALLKIVGTPSGLENEYWFYRGTSPFFEPPAVDQANAISVIPATSTQWQDPTSGIMRSGVGNDYFYFVVAVDAATPTPNISPRSNRVGEMDQPLARNLAVGKAKNWVTVPLQGTGSVAIPTTLDLAIKFRFCSKISDWNGTFQAVRALYTRTNGTPPASGTNLGSVNNRNVDAGIIHVYLLDGDTLGKKVGSESADSFLSVQGNVKEPDKLDSLYHPLTRTGLAWVGLHLRWQFDNSITTAQIWGYTLANTSVLGGEKISRWNAAFQTYAQLGRDTLTNTNNITPPFGTWVNVGAGAVSYGFPYQLDMGGTDNPNSATPQLWPTVR